MTDVTEEQLETLRQIQSCAIANAIETFDIKSRSEGFMMPSIRSIFPDMDNMIGYAVTAVISAEKAPTQRMNVSRPDWFDEILKIPEPRVLVMQDLDYPNVIGSFWGEVQANIHSKLGCVGTVTDGGVRDLDEMRAKGFNAFATEVLVSHAYVHIVDANVPVTVGGLTVNPGDIVMGDKHGVIGIPKEIASEIPTAVEAVEARERKIIDLCNSSDFTLDQLKSTF
jgi:4-hydroxy-4-methyl-2-oxoglutarate aldolase